MIKSLLMKLKTNKDSLNVAVNMTGTMLSMAFTVVFVPLLARLFGQVGYGVYAVLTAFIFTLVNVLDFGVTATIYANVPRLQKQKTDEIFHFLKTVVVFQMIVATLVGFVILGIYDYLDASLFHTSSSPLLRIWVALSIPLFILQNSIQNTLFAMKRFISSNIILNTSNLVRLVLVIGVNAVWGLNLENSILILCVVGPLLFIIPALLYSSASITRIVSRGQFDKSQLQIRYTLANFAAQQFYNVGSRLDLFAISFYGLAAATGDYGIAQKIMLTVVSLVVSVTQVLSPNFSSIKTKVGFAREVRHALAFVAAPSLCFLVFWVVPPWVFNIVIPQKFSSALLLTRWLGVAYAFFAVAQISTLLVLYTFKKPVVLMVSNGLFLASMAILNFTLVPIYGSNGAVTAVFISTALVTVFLGVAISKLRTTLT